MTGLKQPKADMEPSNSLDQYLRLYEESRELFPASEKWTRLREYAFQYLKNKRLPDEKSEEFQRTSINDMFAPDLGVNLGGVDLMAGRRKSMCGVDSLQAIKVIVHNDVPVKIELPRGLNVLPAGLSVKTFAELDGEQESEVVDYLYNLIDNGKENAAEVLNILLGVNGIYISVDRNTEIKVPLQIISYSGGAQPLLSNRKLYIRIGENSSANILSCDHSIDTDTDIHLSNIITCLRIENHGRLSYIEMEETNARSRRYSTLEMHQNEGASLSAASYTLMNGTSRNNFYGYLCGRHGARLNLNGLVIGKDKSSTDNYSYITHMCDHGKSDQLFKYALFDTSKGAFEGLIEIMEGDTHNEAYQNNKNILLSKDARMYSKPQLLIFNDDVKCGHGATTGQLDPAAVYYMQTRGIPRDEARSMLLQAFMNDVVERTDFPGLQERLKHLVERRLKGEDILCGACKLKENEL